MVGITGHLKQLNLQCGYDPRTWFYFIKLAKRQIKRINIKLIAIKIKSNSNL